MSSFETTISVYGPPTPYEFTVVEAEFHTDPEDEYSPDVPRLALKGLVDDPDWDDFTIELKTGKGWEIVDEGQAVSHSQGKKKFDGRSAYGEWIDSIVKGQSENPNLSTLLTDLVNSGESWDANIWVGRKIVIDVKKKVMVDRKTGEENEYGRLIVVDYLGSDDEAVNVASQDKEAANEAAMSKIEELALASDSHAEFADAVLTGGISNDPTITKQVMDSSSDGLYESIRREQGFPPA